MSLILQPSILCMCLHIVCLGVLYLTLTHKCRHQIRMVYLTATQGLGMEKESTDIVLSVLDTRNPGMGGQSPHQRRQNTTERKYILLIIISPCSFCGANIVLLLSLPFWFKNLSLNIKAGIENFKIDISILRLEMKLKNHRKIISPYQ